MSDTLAVPLQPDAADAGLPAPRPRHTVVALLLSLYDPTLGYMYVGRLGRGLALVAALTAATAVALYATLVVDSVLLRWAVFPVLIVLRVWLTADAVVIARHEGKDFRLRRYNRWWAYLAWVVAASFVSPALFNAATTHLARAFSFPARSMRPTIEPGDLLLARVGVQHAPRRGELVVAHSGEEMFILRVVGTPGDVIRSAGGKLTLNGRPLAEPYAHSDFPIDTAVADLAWQRPYLVGVEDPAHVRLTPDDWGPIRVPAGRYLLLGDDRGYAQDGRYTGFTPLGAIFGRPRWIYFSRDPETGAIRWSRIDRGIE